MAIFPTKQKTVAGVNGVPFGLGLALRGAEERLAPILMTALATGPGQEIEYPMTVVILGGLATSTVLNLFVMPALYLRFGRWP